MQNWADGHEQWAAAPQGIQSLSWEGAYSGALGNSETQTDRGIPQEHRCGLGPELPSPS